MGPASFQDQIEYVNGVRLHWVDWGGDGPALLLLPGLGSTARVFDDLAPQFTDRFHVIGLTRRGHPGSDLSPTDYSVETLTEDIRAFLDHLGIQQVILAGHSLAGVEITEFAARYPARTLALVYLDGINDYGQMPAVMGKSPVKDVPPPVSEQDGYRSVEAYMRFLRLIRSDLDGVWCDVFEADVRRGLAVKPDGTVEPVMPLAVNAAIRNDTFRYQRRYAQITAPTLAIVASEAIPSTPAYLTPDQRQAFYAYWDAVWQPWQRDSIRQFREGVPHGQVVILPDTLHYCFLHRPREVVQTTRTFLLEAVPR